MRFKFAAVILLLMLIPAGCAFRHVPSMEYGNQTAAPNVLMATEYGDFKMEVASRAARDLEKKGAYIKVTGLDRLKDENPDDYQAIVLLSSCKAWTLSPKVRKFIKAHPGAREKIILFTTAADPDWDPKTPGVDSTTRASEMASAPDQAALLVIQVRALLE